jgi:hypothetical protein
METIRNRHGRLARSNPERWYGAHEFDDLPPRLGGYVNMSAAPYNRPKSASPALDGDRRGPGVPRNALGRPHSTPLTSGHPFRAGPR